MRGNLLSRYLACLFLALSFALLPTVLVLHSSPESCAAVLSNEDNAHAVASGNPFSHISLCRVRARLAKLTDDVYVHKHKSNMASSAQGTAGKADEQQQQQQAQQGPVPSPSPVQHQQAPSTASTPAPQPSSRQTPVAEPRKQEDSNTPEPYNIQELVITEPYPVPMFDDPGEDWSDFDVPRTQADIDRIMALPHVDQCNFCQVCIPNAALKVRPNGAAHSRSHPHSSSSGSSSNRRKLTQHGEHGPGADDMHDGYMQSMHGEQYRGGFVDSPSACSSAACMMLATAWRSVVQFAQLAWSRLAGRNVITEQGGQGAGTEVGGSGANLAWSQLVQENAYASGEIRSSNFGSGSRSNDRFASHHRHVRSTRHRNLREQSSLQGQPHGVGVGHEGAQGQQQHVGSQRVLLKQGKDGEEEEDYKVQSDSHSIYTVGGYTFDLKDIAPGDRIFKKKSHLPNCTICRGCDHTLEMMASGSLMLNSYYAHEPGGSPSWLFRVRTNKTASGWAVVKVWCVPVLKVKQRGLAMCSPPKVYSQVKLLLAQQKLTRECGLQDIVPKVWVEPVNGIIPGKGFHIKWLGLWADIAEGVSVQNIQEAGKPNTKPEVMLDLFVNKVNHTEVMLGAIFDLLFSQCDRHQQNVFMTETGKVTLIDNDQVFTTAWRKCGIDSMLVPTTQKFMINHLGFFYVLKYPQKEPPTAPAKVLNPLLMLDYRCHAQGGAIGKRFPAKLRQCMSRLQGMAPEAIQLEYGYPNLAMASAVRNRTRDMLAHGYEWTLLWGQPTNQPMHRYKLAPKCCNMTFERPTNRYKCVDPNYRQMAEIPYGNAWHGGKWHGTPGLDTGNYVGGSSFEPIWDSPAANKSAQ